MWVSPSLRSVSLPRSVSRSRSLLRKGVVAAMRPSCCLSTTSGSASSSSSSSPHPPVSDHHHGENKTKTRSSHSTATQTSTTTSSRLEALLEQLQKDEADTNLQAFRSLLDRFASKSTSSGDSSSLLSSFQDEAFYEKVRLPVNEAHTIPPETYRNPVYYQLEESRIFRSAWTVAAHVDDLRHRGDVKTATVAGQPVLLTRDKSDRLHAFYNVCRHRGARLVAADRQSKTPVISCPYHRWGYGLDGKLLATPLWKGDGAKTNTDHPLSLTKEEEDALFAPDEKPPTEEIQQAFQTDHVKNFCKSEYGLLPIRVDTWGPYVFVNLDGTAPPLTEYLGDMVEDLEEMPLHNLVTVRRSSLEIQANWKLLVENFQEYYHLPSVHPGLCEVTRVEDHTRAQGAGMNIGYVVYPLTNADTAVDLDRLPAFKGISGKNWVTGWFHHLFPNAFYFLLPHSLYSIVLEPVGPNKTIEHISLLVDPAAKEMEQADEAIQGCWDYYEGVNGEDLGICEEVQVGIGAKDYPGGRMTFRFEEPLHRFHNMIADYMTGKPRIPPGDPRPYEYQLRDD